jgi:hypothetical protein
VQQRLSQAIFEELVMSVLSHPTEANTKLGHLIVEGLTGTVIALSAMLAVAAVAVATIV